MFRSPFMLQSSLPFVRRLKHGMPWRFCGPGNVDDLNFWMTEFEI